MGLRVPASPCFGWRTEPAPRARGGLGITGPPHIYKPPRQPECHQPSPAGAGTLAEARRTWPSATCLCVSWGSCTCQPRILQSTTEVKTQPVLHLQTAFSLGATGAPAGQGHGAEAAHPFVVTAPSREMEPRVQEGALSAPDSLCQVTSCPHTAPVGTQVLTLRFLTWTPSVWMLEVNTRVPLGTKPCPGDDMNCCALQSWGIRPK